MKQGNGSTKKTSWFGKSLTVALLSLMSYGTANAQAVNCVCTAKHSSAATSCACTDHKHSSKNKLSAPVCAVQHKTTINHRGTAPRRKVYKPAAISPRIETVAATTTTNEHPCYSYRKHNIVVTECPGLMFDSDDRLRWSSDKGYSGYRRSSRMDTTQYRNINPAIAPQSGNFNNDYGPAPTTR